jgi:hypothetical protein
MKTKIFTTVLATISLMSMNVPLAMAENTSDSVEQAIQGNPWFELDSLSRGQKKHLYDQYKKTGIPDVYSQVDFDGSAIQLEPSPTQQIQTFAATSAYDDWATSVNEKINCVVEIGLSLCSKAGADADTAKASAEAKFPSSLHNGQGDAYRHCYWSGLMTHHIGSGNALFVGENHEAFSFTTQEEYEMDTYNNKQGRIAGLNSTRDIDVLNICYGWARNNKLKTL